MYAFIHFIECTVAYMLYRYIHKYRTSTHGGIREKSWHHQSQLDSSSVRKYPGIHPIVVEVFQDYGLKFSTTVRHGSSFPVITGFHTKDNTIDSHEGNSGVN